MNTDYCYEARLDTELGGIMEERHAMLCYAGLTLTSICDALQGFLSRNAGKGEYRFVIDIETNAQDGFITYYGSQYESCVEICMQADKGGSLRGEDESTAIE